MPETYSDWPPRVPRLEEYSVSKRMALKHLCAVEPQTIELVDSGDLYTLNDHFGIGLSVQNNDDFASTLTMQFVGQSEQPPQRNAVGTMRVIIQRQVDVRLSLVEQVLQRLAAEDEKVDLRVIADYLMGSVSEKLQHTLEQQGRWPEIPTAQESLQRAYEKIMAGRLPQNSE